MPPPATRHQHTLGVLSVPPLLSCDGCDGCSTAGALLVCQMRFDWAYLVSMLLALQDTVTGVLAAAAAAVISAHGMSQHHHPVSR